MCIDLIQTQIFNYATVTIFYKNVLLLDADNDVQFVLTTKPVLRATPMTFEPKQSQPAKCPKIFVAQDAVI